MQAISWGRTLNFTKPEALKRQHHVEPVAQRRWPAGQPIPADVGVNPCLFRPVFFGVPKVDANGHVHFIGAVLEGSDRRDSKGPLMTQSSVKMPP